jgi:hypothetical protein
MSSSFPIGVEQGTEFPSFVFSEDARSTDVHVERRSLPSVAKPTFSTFAPFELPGFHPIHPDIF